MKARWTHLAMYAVMAAVPAGSVLAQPAPKADPIAPLPEGQAAPAATPAEPAPLPPPPPPVWRPDQARVLLNYIYNIGREGLSPADYDADGLLAAIASNDPALLAQAATDRFNKISNDLALGHVRGDARVGWHVVDKDLDEASQRELLVAALAGN